MAEYIKNPLSGKLRGVTYEDGKIIDVHIRDTDDVVKVFVPVRHGRWIDGDPYCPICKKDKFRGLDDDIWADWQPDYCPNCGAKMDAQNIMMKRTKIQHFIIIFVKIFIVLE